MMKDESPDQADPIQQFDESETPLAKRSGRDDILNLISKFLELAGNVLLIQGPPGAGKTTLALELLQRVQATRFGRSEIPPTRLYVPSRVSSNKLRRHFPWIHEMHDPFSKKTSTDDSTQGSDEIRVSEADDVFNKVLTLKRSKLRGLMVIDSWKGALRNTSEDGRRMIESAILSDPDDNRVGVVLVSEGGRVGDLPNLVDGIVTLSSSELEGRRLRTIVVNNTVPTMGVRLLLRIINANFVNQGGFSCIVPFSTVSSENVAESLRPVIGEAALNERVRIMEYNHELPQEKWRVPLKGDPLDDFTLFGKIWKEVETDSSSIVLAIDLDKLVQVYRDNLMLPSLSNLGASIRDAGAVTLAVASEP